MKLSRLSLFPVATEINSQGHLAIGGCDVVEVASLFGTPLYIFDEQTLHTRCREIRSEFEQRYSNSVVIYACKAFIHPILVSLLNEEGLGLDIVSGGELSIARAADFPMDKVYFHGNNKSQKELEIALEWGVGRIVVDNIYELHLLNQVAERRATTANILLRISPGVDPHTHRYISTGVLDSKFGFPITTNQAEEALKMAISCPHLNLLGLHFHIGSSIFDPEPYREAIRITLQFAAMMRQTYSLELQELNVGGGFAVAYTIEDPPCPIASYAETITSSLIEQTRELGLPAPQLIIEPGRSISAPAGVALYTIGGEKEIPGVRHYVFVDGGMGDNIRPPLYGARYEAMVANKAHDKESENVTIAGKFCESGDILIHDIMLPPLKAGDILALPVCGAYSLPTASNYNGAPRPAVVMVKGGESHLIRRRETYEDLIQYDIKRVD